MPSRIGELIAQKYRDYSLVLILFGFVSALLLVNLRSLVPLLTSEDPATLGVLSGRYFMSDILFLPIRFIQYVLIKLDLPATDLRFASVALGLLACVVMYQLLRKWHTRRVSFGSVVFFGSSSLFLAVSRLATPDVIYFLAIPLLLMCGSWLRKKHDINKLPLSVFITASLLYLPGMWLFVLAGILTLRKRLAAAWRLNSYGTKLLMASVGFLLLMPLIFSFFKNPSQITAWIGLPALSDITPGSIFHNFVDIFNALFWHGLSDKSLWLTGTAVLDIFAIATMVLGLYYYQFGYHPLRKRVLFGFGAIAITLLSLGGPVPLALLLPLVYIFSAAGIALLLQQWFTVFPHNPLARAAALLLVSAVIAASCYYQTQRYFVAWPSSPQTIQAIQSEKL